MSRLKYTSYFSVLAATVASFFLLLTPSAPQAAIADDYPAVWKEANISQMSDSWGNGNRQCTSWVAWKLWQVHHYSAKDWGNANQWVISANARAIPTSTQPIEKSVAVDESFSPGHVMWVERINQDGTIHISEYNNVPGEYTERDIQPVGLTFVDVKGGRL